MVKKPSNLPMVIVAFFSFFVLGITNGLLGVAWPSIRETFQLPLDAVGAVLVASTIGYTACSLISGQAITRLGAGLLLLLASISVSLGLLGQTTTPVWWVFVMAAFFLGSGNGSVDAGVNIHLASRVRAGVMNWLHACYGIGATLGPLLITGAISLQQTWRGGYMAALGIQVFAVLVFAASLKAWGDRSQVAPANPRDAPTARTVTPLQTLAKASTWIYILILFTSAGLESTAGQWAFSVFSLARHVPEVQAGVWISFYWLSFTIGRILAGAVVHWFKPLQLIRLAVVLTILGGVLFWWNPLPTVGFLGLALIGFSLAPVIPTLISNTPRFIGKEHAPNAIGFQVAAMSTSFGVFPTLAGIFANRIGLETLGPYLTALALVVWILFEISMGMQKKESVKQ